MTILYKQALDLLDARSLVMSLDHDLTRLIRRELSASPGGSDDIADRVLKNILLRWNCALSAADDEVTARQKNLIVVTLPLLLHKYGIQDPSLNSKAYQAIEALNREVILSDSFYRKSSAIKELLSSPVALRSRKPARPADLTFWRTGDLVAYQIGGKFYALYIHGIVGANEAPIVEFMDMETSYRPVRDDVLGKKARGIPFKDGVLHVQHYLVYGMRDMPDPANQFHLLGNMPQYKPDQTHLAPPIGMGIVTDVFRLADEVREKLFP